MWSTGQRKYWSPYNTSEHLFQTNNTSEHLFQTNNTSEQIQCSYEECSLHHNPRITMEGQSV
jgi:hypothetical protein